MISIIVPCYNVENYIDRCLKSITEQTIGISNLEIILVNDASTDGTLSKLKEWEKRYPENITVITYDTNLRQGGARNVGLSYASGDYIGFVDSDDFLEKQMYELLLKGIEESGCDVARCMYVRDSGSSAGCGRTKGKPEFRVVRCFEEDDLFYMPTISATEADCEYGGIPTMLFKRSLIYDHDISFPEGISYEDNYWLGVVQLYISSMCVIDKVLYHYYVNNDSTTMKKNDMRQLERLDIEVALLEEYKRRGAFKPFYFRIMADFIQRYYLNTYHILFTRFTDIPEIYHEIMKNVYDYFPDWEKQFDAVNPDIVAGSSMLKLLADKEDHSIKEVLTAYMKDHKYVF